MVKIPEGWQVLTGSGTGSRETRRFPIHWVQSDCGVKTTKALGVTALTVRPDGTSVLFTEQGVTVEVPLYTIDSCRAYSQIPSTQDIRQVLREDLRPKLLGTLRALIDVASTNGLGLSCRAILALYGGCEARLLDSGEWLHSLLVGFGFGVDIPQSKQLPVEFLQRLGLPSELWG